MLRTRQTVVGFPIPLLLAFRVMVVWELDQAVDEQLNSDADANADTDDDTNAEKKKCRGKKTNAIPDAEAYH